MKTWIITLPFLCAAGVAMAQGVAQPTAAGQNEPVVVPAEILTPAEPAAVGAAPAATPEAKAPMKAKAAAKSPSGSRTSKRGARTLPTGDMRHCLDRKTREGIIRCSETRPKK
jgi:hypothetical protein